MASFVVLEAGQKPDSDVRMVRDGFSLLGFFFPLFWLLWHRLWLEALLVLFAGVLIIVLSGWGGFQVAVPVLTFLLSLYVGLEGAFLRISGMRRRGWRLAGVIEAENVSEAQIRYATAREEIVIAETPVRQSGLRPETARTASGPAFGLLDYPGA